MEENQFENQMSNAVSEEPDLSENFSDSSDDQSFHSESEEGQSAENADPAKLILGKFKSQEDLVKAYQDLEKLQGNQSAELGELRHSAGAFRNLGQLLNQQLEIKGCEEALAKISQKYNTPEYFQDPSFRELYKQAFLGMRDKLDTDYMINLLEGYVSGRISAYERAKAAEAETNKAISGVKFDKNQNTEIQKPSKRLDEMTPQEIDDLLDRLI